jgi:hypothetical protein
VGECNLITTQSCNTFDHSGFVVARSQLQDKFKHCSVVCWWACQEGTTINDRGEALNKGIIQRLKTQFRITMLAMILLDCFGYEDVERDAILKFTKQPNYKWDFKWLREHLKDGAISEVIRDFHELQEEAA